MGAGSAGAGSGAPRQRKDPAAGGLCGGSAGGGARPPQARFWRAGRSLAARASARSCRRSSSVPVARAGPTEGAHGPEAMDSVRPGRVGAAAESELVKRVTVLMAVRDAPVDQLETAIGSIRAQTLSDF